ncbi:hypothetical protein ACIPIN_23380 [Pseudomonas sp. NPDC087697]|uniref:hypothetical protein n=1 Tax=Pseudomonas sp. NPDC087697 TaxID=3364447 RepID=UPI0037F3004A
MIPRAATSLTAQSITTTRQIYLRGEFRQMSCQYVMNSNYAFGGVNTSLIFRRWS